MNKALDCFRAPGFYSWLWHWLDAWPRASHLIFLCFSFPLQYEQMRETKHGSSLPQGLTLKRCLHSLLHSGAQRLNITSISYCSTNTEQLHFKKKKKKILSNSESISNSRKLQSEAASCWPACCPSSEFRNHFYRLGCTAGEWANLPNGMVFIDVTNLLPPSP